MPASGWGRGLLFLALVGRHLLRHRLRAGLTLAGVALGVAVAVAVQLANHSAMASFERSVRSVAGEARLTVLAPGGDLDENVVTRMRPLTDAARLEPVIEGVAVLADHPETAFRLLGVDLLSPAAFRDYAPPPGSAANGPEGLFITATAATRLGLKAGDPLPLWIDDQRLVTHVAGILPAAGPARTLDPMVAFTDVSLAQELMRRVGRLDRVDLVPRPGQPLAGLSGLVKPLLAPGERVEEPEESNRQAERMLLAFRTNMRALSYVALIVGAYLIYNAIAISVVQRRREVATLRALGTRRREIFALFALEACLMGGTGAAIGLGLGALLAGAAVKAVGLTVNSLYLAAPVTGVAWTWTAFATGIGVGVGLALVAALVPAIDAARTPPALAMRPGSWEARQGGRVAPFAGLGALLLALAWVAAKGPVVDGLPVWGYVSATLVVLGNSLLAPAAVAGVAALAGRLVGEGAIGPIAVRNFRRAVGRNAVAVAALMVGLAMTVGVATMVSSFRTTVGDWVGQTLPANFYLKAMGAVGTRHGLTLDPAIMPALKAVPEVQAVEAMRNAFITYQGVTIRLGGGDADVLAEHGSLVLASPGTPRALYGALVGQDNVLASETMAIKHGVRAGGEIELPTARGPHRFHVVGLFLDYSSDQGYVLIDRGTYRHWWGDEGITDIAIYLKPGADAVAARGGIQRAIGTRPIRIQASGELREAVLDVFDHTFAITYALHVIAIAVSLLGVVGTLFALVLERQRELSVLRYVGLTRGQIRQLVLAESGLLGLAGALVGLVAGAMLSALLIEVINRQSFGWSVQWHPPWGFIAAACGSLVAAALLAGLYPARLAAHLSVAEGLRRE